MKNRILSVFLTVLMITSLAACSGGGDAAAPVGTTSPAESQTGVGTETSVSKVPDMSPALPDKDYKDYKFTVLALDSTSETWVVKDIWVAEQNGEPIADAVYERNRRVEEKYGVKIGQKLDKKPLDVAKNSIMAGDDEYDAVQTIVTSTLALAQLKYIHEISSIPYIDLEQPWWDSSTINSTELAGKRYLLLGDINIVDDDATWCLLFNKKLIENLKLEDIYKVVREGGWTLDSLAKYSRAAYSDINGNGEVDQNDQLGFLASGNAAGTLLWTTGNTTVTVDKNGVPKLDIQSEKIVTILNRVYDIYADKSATFQCEKMTHPDGWSVGMRAIFKDGRALFIGCIVAFVPLMRDMEDDFGVIPMPKYDEKQNDYITIFQSWSGTSYSVPVTAKDVERNGIVLEAMASASVNTLTPAYYSTALQRKYTRDEASSEMLDLIFSTRKFDLAYAFDWGGLRAELQKSLTKDSNTIVSDIAAIEGKIKTAMETAYTEFSKK